MRQLRYVTLEGGDKNAQELGKNWMINCFLHLGCLLINIKIYGV